MRIFSLTRGDCELSALMCKGQVVCVCVYVCVLRLHMVSSAWLQTLQQDKSITDAPADKRLRTGGRHDTLTLPPSCHVLIFFFFT